MRLNRYMIIKGIKSFIFLSGILFVANLGSLRSFADNITYIDETLEVADVPDGEECVNQNDTAPNILASNMIDTTNQDNYVAKSNEQVKPSDNVSIIGPVANDDTTNFGPGYMYNSVKVLSDNLKIYKDKDKKELLTTIKKNKAITYLECINDDVTKVKTDAGEGYIFGNGKNYQLSYTQKQSSPQKQTNISSSTDKRNALVAKAMTHLGNKYVFGGASPLTGFDCSGFVQYLYKDVLKIDLNRNSAAQSTQGRVVKTQDIQKGDLLFYSSNGKNINHVGMYIGDGKIIHAATEKTGVKISNWNYRNPVIIKNIID